jgi:hypothetical protein
MQFYLVMCSRASKTGICDTVISILMQDKENVVIFMFQARDHDFKL